MPEKKSTFINVDENQLVYAIDTETTGVNASIDRIRSISLVGGTRKDGISRRLSFLIDTNGAISAPDALKVHKIPDHKKGGVPLGLAFRLMDEIIDGPVMGHNLSFDTDFVENNARRDNIEIPKFMSQPRIDTLIMARELSPPGSPVNLDAVCRRLDMPRFVKKIMAERSTRHDDLDDCVMAFYAWCKMTEPAEGSLLDFGASPTIPQPSLAEPIDAAPANKTPSNPEENLWV